MLTGRRGGPRPTCSRDRLRSGARAASADSAPRKHLRGVAQQAHLGPTETQVSEHRASCGLQCPAAPSAPGPSPRAHAAASPGVGRRALLSASTTALVAAAGGTPPAMALKVVSAGGWEGWGRRGHAKAVPRYSRTLRRPCGRMRACCTTAHRLSCLLGAAEGRPGHPGGLWGMSSMRMAGGRLLPLARRRCDGTKPPIRGPPASAPPPNPCHRPSTANPS